MKNVGWGYIKLSKELLDTWYVCLYRDPLSHPTENYLKENNILQMSYSWEE